MRKLLPVLPLLLLLPINGSPAPGQGRPIPPGVLKADKVMDAHSQDDPPTLTARSPRAAQLRSESEELAKLAAAIPPQVVQVTQGQLPKSLGDQLKRIENLSKHLRNEIYP
jgi:hypothetical protein